MSDIGVFLVGFALGFVVVQAVFWIREVAAVSERPVVKWARANANKPHRCPRCHAVRIRGDYRLRIGRCDPCGLRWIASRVGYLMAYGVDAYMDRARRRD